MLYVMPGGGPVWVDERGDIYGFRLDGTKVKLTSMDLLEVQMDGRVVDDSELPRLLERERKKNDAR